MGGGSLRSWNTSGEELLDLLGEEAISTRGDEAISKKGEEQLFTGDEQSLNGDEASTTDFTGVEMAEFELSSDESIVTYNKTVDIDIDPMNSSICM